MEKRLRGLCLAYLLLALLSVGIAAPLTYSLPALVVLLVALLVSFRPVRPGLQVVADASFVFLLPLLTGPVWAGVTRLGPLASQIIAAASTLPVLYLLDASLKGNATLSSPVGKGGQGRHVTDTILYLTLLVPVMLALSFLLSNRVVFFSTLVFVLYLAGIFLRAMTAIPARPIQLSSPITRRVVAGGTLTTEHALTSRASTDLHVRIEPEEGYVQVAPAESILGKSELQLTLTITPPLSGPATPQLRITVLDPRGILETEQSFAQVELHVIPRAKYAVWLATRFLEHAAEGAVVASAMATTVNAMPRRGTDYHGSREYQPGDSAKRIDWKHSIKLNQMVVKEFIEGGKQAAIIAVNLSVTGGEEADELAFDLVTTALTLAQEGVPTGMAAYDRQGVILSLPITDAREVLRQSLALIKRIRSEEFGPRCLELTDFENLRRNMAQLRRASSAPAQRLLEVLDFEYKATEYAARKHPAALALSPVVDRAPGPAIVLLVTRMNHDAAAVRVMTDKLSRRDFIVIPVDGGK